jgi:ABC-type sugar transport system substrate-binding protein
MVNVRLHSRGAIAATAVASTLLVTAACGSIDSGTESESGGAAAGLSSAKNYANYDSALEAMSKETVKTSKFKKSGNLNIVSIWQGQNNGFGQTYKVSMDHKAKEYGKRVSLKWLSFDFDTNKEISTLQNAVNTHPDAIILQAGDAGALVAPVAQAQDAGVPVIVCIDGVLGNKFTSWAGQNYYNMAYKAATNLADEMGGKGEVAVFNGVAGNMATVLWSTAAKAAFAKFPGIKIVASYYSEWNVGKARQQSASLIAAHPNVKGIFTGGSEMAVGAIEAYVAAGKESSIPAFGVVNVLNGFLRLAKQYDVKFSGFPLAPAMSTQCLDQAVKILDGKSVKKFRDAAAPLPGGGAGYTQDELSKWYVPELNDQFVPPATAPIEVYKAAGMGR